ncbi:hypothetical protein RRG08_001969 [Elysia crispata]|uniref:Mutator-like transposase domain-containing protein n=1 Tax=Elysia crispata TaxID=231223 RepID=A0AAE1BCF7_9GAST|nr:hypothetical protein RRG08_001969 [Elysia crispata]
MASFPVFSVNKNTCRKPKLNDRWMKPGQAAAIVRNKHFKHYHLDVNDEDIIDISVSFDSSWLTRGHKSLIGIGCVIDVLTGLITDGHMSNLHCQICASVENLLDGRHDNFSNAGDNSCESTINFQGSSGMMEMKAAEYLSWLLNRRSPSAPVLATWTELLVLLQEVHSGTQISHWARKKSSHPTGLQFSASTLRVHIGQACINAAFELKKRLFKSTLEEQQKIKKRKKITAADREKARQEKEAEEGGPAYQAGIF